MIGLLILARSLGYGRDAEKEQVLRDTIVEQLCWHGYRSMSEENAFVNYLAFCIADPSKVAEWIESNDVNGLYKHRENWIKYNI